MKRLHAVLYAMGSVLLLLGVLLAILVRPGETVEGPCVFSRHLTGNFERFLVLAFLCSGGLILGNAPYLIFGRASRNDCSIQTSLCSLGISACVGVGLYCLFSFVMCHVMSSPARHPVAYPMSVAVGVLSLIGAITLVCLYVRERRGWWRAAGGTMDAWCVLSHVLPCFFACAFLHDVISDWLRMM